MLTPIKAFKRNLQSAVKIINFTAEELNFFRVARSKCFRTFNDFPFFVLYILCLNRFSAIYSVSYEIIMFLHFKKRLKYGLIDCK